MKPQKKPQSRLDALRALARALPGGVKALNEFLGENCEPVAPAVAESRAAVCQVCPRNTPASDISAAVHIAANAVRVLKRLKSGLGLRVENEKALGICSVCFCDLPLKVHVSIETIQANTREETMNALPENCWIKKESKI